MKTLYVKDFGAVGDGVTDDGVAILAAVSELRNSPKGSTLIFEKNKTYYYNNSGIEKLFYLRDNEGLTIKGDNTLIKLGGTDLSYMDIRRCKDITIEGFNFDYGDHKPAFAGKVLELNAEEGWAIITADRDIHLATGEEAYPLQTDWFAIIPYKVSRCHMYLEKYEMLDAAQRKVKVFFAAGHSLTMERLVTEKELLFSEGLVLPDPFTGNARGNLECGFIIEYVENFTMRNINIYSVARHGFATFFNSGKCLFENVNFVRAPYDQDLRYTSWADTYHVIHNRAKYTWINCKNEWNYDDVFNISSATMFADEVYSSTDILLRDHAQDIDDLQPGDVLTFVDVSTGKVFRTTVKAATYQANDKKRVTLNDAVPFTSDKANWYVWSDTFCAPGSEFIDCDFNGTFRARTELTMTNCKIHNRRFWIGLEAKYAEGPLPQNVVFRNCEFVVENNFDIQIGATKTESQQMNGIIFDNCTGVSRTMTYTGWME